MRNWQGAVLSDGVTSSQGTIHAGLVDGPHVLIAFRPLRHALSGSTHPRGRDRDAEAGGAARRRGEPEQQTTSVEVVECVVNDRYDLRPGTLTLFVPTSMCLRVGGPRTRARCVMRFAEHWPSTETPPCRLSHHSAPPRRGRRLLSGIGRRARGPHALGEPCAECAARLCWPTMGSRTVLAEAIAAARRSLPAREDSSHRSPGTGRVTDGVRRRRLAADDRRATCIPTDREGLEREPGVALSAPCRWNTTALPPSAVRGVDRPRSNAVADVIPHTVSELTGPSFTADDIGGVRAISRLWGPVGRWANESS